MKHREDCMSYMVSRRVLLRTGGLAASALALGSAVPRPTYAATAPSLNAFMTMSQKLTGRSSLDRDMGQAILDAFVTTGQTDDLAALAADPDPGRSRLKIANAVLAAWYSGLSPVPGATEVTGYNEALVWDALSYTKPPGSCGGETGYWSSLPS